MEDSSFLPYAQFLARWIHYVSGVCWIGLLYFLNLVNVPLQGKLDAGIKKKILSSRAYAKSSFLVPLGCYVHSIVGTCILCTLL